MSLVRAKDQSQSETFEEYYSWLSQHQPKMARTMSSVLDAINILLKEKKIYAHTSHEALVLHKGPETFTEGIVRIQCQPENHAALVVYEYFESNLEKSWKIIGQNLTVADCMKTIDKYLTE